MISCSHPFKPATKGTGISLDLPLDNKIQIYVALTGIDAV